MAIGNLSCRYAFKNHTKNIVTATRTDTKKAGPTQGYFDTPHSSVLHLSALMSNPSLIDLPACYRCTNPQKRGVFPLFGFRLANYLKTYKYMIRQIKTTFTNAPEKMTPSARNFLCVSFILTACLIWQTYGCRPAVHPLPPQTMLHPKAASMVTY